MKRIFYVLLVTILAFQSCSDNDWVNTSKETNAANLAIAKSMITTATYDVPVVSGYTTVASYKGTVLARTAKAMSIIAPKDTQDIHLSYVENETPTSLAGMTKATSAPQTYSNLWQTILFEDSRSGDFDYNDLVAHVNYQKTGNTMTVGIQPIAFGATKNIKLGFKWTQGANGGEEIIAENCRKELFKDETTDFINTYGGYRTHYDDFAATKSFSLPSETEAVEISWFIEVDNGNRIYGINQNGDKCIDATGSPYGFALTDCSVASTTQKGMSLLSSDGSSSTDKAWESCVPQINSWVKDLGDAPSIPATATDITTYVSWKANNASTYSLASGVDFSTDLNVTKNMDIYVAGNLTVGSVYGGKTATFYVLKGGTLTLPASLTVPCNIYNYGGTVKFDGTEKIYLSNVNYLDNGDITIGAQTFQVGANATVVCRGTLTAPNISTIGGGKLFAEDITCSGNVQPDGSSLIYVDGTVNAANVYVDNESTLYAQCGLVASNELKVTNSATLSVRSHIKAPSIDLSAGANVNVNEGALIEADNFLVGNSTSVRITSKNKGTSLIVAKAISFKENTYDKLFTGVFTIVSDNVDPAISSLTSMKDVTFNGEVTLAPDAKGCHNGYNVQDNSDNGLAWFSFPLERVNINTCYDFDKWKVGNFDFTLKTGAKVFDITDKNPKEGAKLPIFQMK